MMYFISAQLIATTSKKLKRDIFYFNGKIELNYDDFNEAIISNRFYDELLNLYGYTIEELKDMGLALVITSITPLNNNS